MGGITAICQSVFQAFFYSSTAQHGGYQSVKADYKPAVRAKLILDGDAEHAVLLDSNFDEDWGDCLYLEPVLHHGTRTKHTVEIIIPETESGEDTPFYLMSLIIA